MKKLDKDYQQVVENLTKLEEDTGLKKSNFYVLPDSKDQAITFGLFLPNQQKEDGLKTDINVNFASFKNPEGDFDNYKEFEKAFIEKNKDVKIPNITLKDVAKCAWSSMREDGKDYVFLNNHVVADNEENISDSLVNDADNDYIGLIDILSSYS